MRRLICLAMLLPCAPAIAGDEQPATPPPRVGPPAMATSSGPAAGLDEERIAEMIDAAIERAMARRTPSASPPAPSTWSAPRASAQVATIPAPRRIVPAAAPRRIGFVPAYITEDQYADVLVPAPWHRRAIGALGERLAECGRPRVRSMRLAPRAVAACAAPSALPSAQSE